MKDRLIFWINFAPLFLSIIITLFILFSSKFLPPKLPLFYSLSWGDSQLADNKQLLVIPASITLIALLNLILSWQLHPSQTFFRKILQYCSILITIILTITFLKIIFLFF